jgi:hypothetical protein
MDMNAVPCVDSSQSELYTVQYFAMSVLQISALLHSPLVFSL